MLILVKDNLISAIMIVVKVGEAICAKPRVLFNISLVRQINNTQESYRSRVQLPPGASDECDFCAVRGEDL